MFWFRAPAVRRALILTLPCWLAAAPRTALAQLFANRTLVNVPLDDSLRKAGFLAGFDFLGGAQHSWQSAGGDRAWDIHLVNDAELWRFNRNTTVVAGTATEVVANDLKDGGFNPRGVSWELGIGFHRRIASAVAQFSFVHYCRHAIDSADPPGPEYSIPGYVPQQRTASFNGFRTSINSPPVQLGNRLWVRASVAGEVYRDQWDSQVIADDPDSWRHARGASLAAIRLEAPLTARQALFVRGVTTGVLFQTSGIRPNVRALRETHRIEGGLRAYGHLAAMEFYLVSEDLFDDLMTPSPRGSHILGFGIRAVGLNGF
jgi:hypothetical protein